MDLSAADLIANLVISSVGFGLFIFGKKQGRVAHFTVGVALMGLPYVVPAAAAMWAIAAALSLGLFLLGRMGI
ncbi:amino acid transport protein [Engelhardtia mirabilis]|uniref:Amino acid transport protein n=1 Tax=Engelhardtia mirabilis TaxID=2528011 RepID=A0A518BMD1_9BACT|nr:hypothetical protein Pla133_32350 [Planctomycetes bacterium Pla133]QDV02467.1 hypothetical protein Pla86_32340 [Planctomycetes bacterium Pla86]